MAKLKAGAMMVDLATGGIYGDIACCPREDLLESAEALLSLLPQVQHKGLWGIGKAYDADCYLYTSHKSYQEPKGLNLPAEIERGSGCPYGWRKPFNLIAFSLADRQRHFEMTDYEPLVGSVREGKVSPNIEGIPDLTAPAREEKKRRRREQEREELARGKQMSLGF